jgi:FixJ family two-component response regulator
LRVLLVDNDESLLRALARSIRLAGFEVEAFSTAEGLLARDASESGACLVLDVDLPGMGGIELKRTLADSGRDLPTVFITALHADDVGESLAMLCPVAVLYKPFNKEVLLGAISRACG